MIKGPRCSLSQRDTAVEMVGSLGLSWGVLGMGHGGVGAWRGWKVVAGLIRVKEEGGDGEDRLLLGLWIRCWCMW